VFQNLHVTEDLPTEDRPDVGKTSRAEDIPGVAEMSCDSMHQVALFAGEKVWRLVKPLAYVARTALQGQKQSTYQASCHKWQGGSAATLQVPASAKGMFEMCQSPGCAGSLYCDISRPY
jgi:hypothetical protein